MKYLTTAALALVLAVGAAQASAQPQSNDQRDKPAAPPSHEVSGRAAAQGPTGAAGPPAYRIAPSNQNAYVPASGFVVGPQGGGGVHGAGAHPGAFSAPTLGGLPGAGHAARGRDSGRA